MVKPKQCPDCGGNVKVHKARYGWKVVCTKCGAGTGRYWYWTEKYAVEAWNRKVSGY